MRRLSIALAFCLATAGSALAQNKEPLLLRDMGSFHVGGRVIEVTGQPADLANLVCFLASPLARYITGTVIPVDGGLRRYQF